MTRRPLQRAFTLFEVMVAIAIFALMGVALLEAVAVVQEAVAATRRDSGRGEFRRFALRRVLAAQTREALTAGGNLTLDDGGSVSWTVTLADTTIPDLHQAVVTLDWSGSEPEELTLWVFRPEWSESETRSNLIQNLRTEYPSDRFSTF
ncbi:MAG: prepilin-type N-terminal cleavage/methylation domain-containing protein [Puniceicoccales bacterium]|jgi:prepilin-type N-terminal cleavage/methylation domain-containing protein|nr:prepilin-type N-terminal cleavage/methylation domain-containing protein [Puniceicoccales bacterium]